MPTTIDAGQLTRRLSWRERQVLSVLQAGGWIAEAKFSMIPQFETGIDQIRGAGIPAAHSSGIHLYRVGPKPWLPSPPPPANPTKPAFVLTPMSRRQKPAAMASHSPESLEALAAGDKEARRWEVYRHFCCCREHGATTDEIAVVLGLMPNQISGRVGELVDAGLITPPAPPTGSKCGNELRPAAGLLSPSSRLKASDPRQTAQPYKDPEEG